MMRLLFAIVLLTTACQVPASGPTSAPAAAPLTTHAVPASEPADERLTVLLHGYGSNEHDLVALAPQLGLRGEIVSFRAPERAGKGYAWFPIEFTPDGTRYAADAADVVVERLAAELRTLRAKRKAPVVVVGFSQGAMMAMLLAAEHPDTVDAAVAFSGALPRAPRNVSSPSPVFMAHGSDDDVVPIARARQAREWLTEQGVDVLFIEVPGLKHRSSPFALERARFWLESKCPATGCGV